MCTLCLGALKFRESCVFGKGLTTLRPRLSPWLILGFGPEPLCNFLQTLVKFTLTDSTVTNSVRVPQYNHGRLVLLTMIRFGASPECQCNLYGLFTTAFTTNTTTSLTILQLFACP